MSLFNKRLAQRERQKYLFSVIQEPNNIDVHQARINFELNDDDNEALAGAILDFLIADIPKTQQKILYIIHHCKDRLSNDWLILFYNALFTIITPQTPVINSKWSVLTEDITGNFNFI